MNNEQLDKLLNDIISDVSSFELTACHENITNVDEQIAVAHYRMFVHTDPVPLQNS